MEINILGLSRIVTTIQRAGVALPQEFRQAMALTVTDIRRTAQERVPVKTNHLRQSITTAVSDSPLTGMVMVGAPYGRFIEYGTRPHVILPRRSNVLAFTVGGSLVFAKKVNHPGTKAQPFMWPAFKENRAGLLRHFQAAATIVLAKIKGA